jgi:hypothetical protein
MFGLVRFGLTKPTFSSANIIVLDYTWKLTCQKCEQMRRLVCGWLKGLLQLEQAKVITLALWWQKRELRQYFISTLYSTVQYTSVSVGQGQHRRVMTSPSRTLP